MAGYARCGAEVEEEDEPEESWEALKACHCDSVDDE